MTTIEPTQEQRDAALAFCGHHDTYRRSLTSEQGYIVSENTVAEFLAEREALAVGRAMRSFADALGGDAVNIAIESAVGRAMRDLVDELGGDVMGRATATAAEVRAMCDLHEQRAIDALTKRNAALLADKEDLSRQLRRVEEDRDAIQAACDEAQAKVDDMQTRAEKAEHALADRDMVLATVKEVFPQVADLDDCDERDLAIGRMRTALDGCTLMVVSAGTYAQREKERDAAHAEVAALKAKLAKAEASLREVLNLAHGADDGLTLADCIPTEVAARAESALSPAGAGTEWAAPIAAADAEKRGTP